MIHSKTYWKGKQPEINAGTYNLSISGKRLKDINNLLKKDVMSWASYNKRLSFSTTYFCFSERDANLFKKIMNHDYRTGKL